MHRYDGDDDGHRVVLQCVVADLVRENVEVRYFTNARAVHIAFAAGVKCDFAFVQPLKEQVEGACYSISECLSVQRLI